MNKSEDNLQSQPEELSLGKKALVTGWRGLLKLNSQDAPLTGQVMGKKMLWGIGSGILANFSGMGIVGCLVSALAGMIFNHNITKIGGTLSDALQGKVKLTDKSVWGPLLGGAAGFGVSAFGFNGGFLSSLIVSILGVSATDRLINMQDSHGKSGERSMDVPEKKADVHPSKETRETQKVNKEGLSQKREDTIDLDKRRIPHCQQPTRMSEQELLAIVNSSPTGVAAVKDKFQDMWEYNEFIARNGLKGVTESQKMSRFEGVNGYGEKGRELTVHAEGAITKPERTIEKHHVKMGLG